MAVYEEHFSNHVQAAGEAVRRPSESVLCDRVPDKISSLF